MRKRDLDRHILSRHHHALAPSSSSPGGTCHSRTTVDGESPITTVVAPVDTNDDETDELDVEDVDDVDDDDDETMSRSGGGISNPDYNNDIDVISNGGDEDSSINQSLFAASNLTCTAKNRPHIALRKIFDS